MPIQTATVTLKPLSATPEIRAETFDKGLPNTLIEIMYRDASNYKQYGEVVLAGALTLDQARAIMASLDGNDNFIPEQVGLEPMEWSGPGGAYDDDHPYHEIFSIEQTDRAVTDERQASDVAGLFVQIGPDGWTPPTE
jgi:hypothetical protein